MTDDEIREALRAHRDVPSLADAGDEPVTEEWLQSIGFVFREDKYGSCDSYVLGDPSEVLPQSLSVTPSVNSWVYGCCSVVPPKTRGDVLRLCTALGVPVAGGREGGGA
jgi:hypothetical protein